VITSSLWRGNRYAVLGLARSGRATVDALLASGAEVVAWDESAEARVAAAMGSSPERGGGPAKLVEGHPRVGPALNKQAHPPVPLHHLTGGPPPRAGEDLAFADPLTIDLSGFTAVIVSPGVPLNRHPIAAHAAAHAVPIIGDIELFAQARAELPPHKVVGITGTNGKSTTTALVHHILQTAGVPTTMGGNIGLPILAQDPLPEGGVYVLELSSYQIDLTFSLDCEVAVLLNITPDHLDRYASFRAYADAKVRLFDMQDFDRVRNGTARQIFVGDDDEAREVGERSSPSETTVWAHWLDSNDEAQLSRQSEWPALQGPHNAQNAIAAITVAESLGIDLQFVNRALRTYPGLPHRMERIAEANGILFVNDSKATNAASTAPALAAYPPSTDGRARIHWIAGGLAKEDGVGECAAHLGNVARAYLIGDAAPMLARHLAGQVPVEQSGTLDAAVRDAMVHAQPGDVILLSPAAASFDQFRDFEARGAQFRAIVQSITAAGGQDT
jgi:UDP-N-acetylmuramoylalanine--D-glutamate ligase